MGLDDVDIKGGASSEQAECTQSVNNSATPSDDLHTRNNFITMDRRHNVSAF